LSRLPQSTWRFSKIFSVSRIFCLKTPWLGMFFNSSDSLFFISQQFLFRNSFIGSSGSFRISIVCKILNWRSYILCFFSTKNLLVLLWGYAQKHLIYFLMVPTLFTEFLFSKLIEYRYNPKLC